MHLANYNPRTAFLLGLATFAVTDQASAYEIKQLTYLDGGAATNLIQSVNGGVPFIMKTDGGLSMSATSNLVTMKSYNLKDSEIPGPALSGKHCVHLIFTDDDAFYSSTAQGHLAYTTPSALTLFSGFPKAPSFYNLNQYDWPAAFQTTGIVSAQQQPLNPNYNAKAEGLLFNLSILSDQGKVTCRDSYGLCKVIYSEDYTPQLIDVLPNIVWAGAPVTLALESRKCHAQLPAGLPPFHYSKIDGVSLDTTIWPATNVDTTGENKETDRLEYGLDFLNRYMGSNKPTKSARFELSYTRFGKPTIRKSANHCNWAGTECWTVRIHPRIDSISASSGFLTGGQTLKITGHGLSGTTKTVTVDGIECYVEPTSTDTELVCTTGKKAAASTVGVAIPGQPGIKYNNGTTPRLTTAIETLHPNKPYSDKKTHTFEGWFKAPETGEYRFYVAADDSSNIQIDSVNPFVNGSEPKSLATVAANTVYSIGYRNWNISPQANPDQGNYRSEWIQLTAGKYYPFKATHVDGGGGYWFTGAVEFKKTALSHPHATRAVQQIRIEQTLVAESFAIEITNPNDSKFRLGLKTADMELYWYTTDGVPCNASADQMKNLIKGYFETKYGSWIWVVRTMYDAAGVLTENAALSKKNVYTVSLTKRISGTSFTAFTVTPFGVITPKIAVKLPTDSGMTQSSAPLAGKVVVSCQDQSNVTYKTRPLSVLDSVETISTAINQDIPHLHGRVSVQEKNWGTLEDKGKFLHKENGRNIFLIFEEVDYNPKQCVFESDVTTPLTGNTPTFPAQIDQAYGTGIIFSPIGLEFLYTSVTKPQVLVSIDSLPALCINLNCDYQYVESTSKVTQQTYDTATKVLTVTGTALPLTDVKVTFGGVGCAASPVPTYTETQIQCTLAEKPRAGNIKVEVRTGSGLIPVDSGLTAVAIDLVVSTVSPTSINNQGGDVLTITGSGFPLDPLMASVKLSDGAICAIQTISQTQIVCKFKKTTATTTSAVNVEVFNYDYYSARRELRTIVPISNTTKSITITRPPQVTAISLNNVSPVVKQPLTFTLTGYNDTLLASQLKVTLVNNADYTRDIYVMSVDNAAKTFTVKFNGAPQGDYSWQIVSTSASNYGIIDTTPITFKTSSTISNVTPTSCSILGGTLLTITGTNFSSVIIDQAVTVVVSPLLYIYCDILTATTTEITCRIRKTTLDPSVPLSNLEVVVVLAGSSEAVSACPSGLCKINFVAPVASVTSLTQGYDSASKALTFTLAGTGFTSGNTNSVSLYVDGEKQTTVSVDSATSAVFRITNVKNTSSTNVAIYFTDGLPTGHASLTSLTFNQKFIELTPTTGGSQGGTLLTIKGAGFGLNTTGLGLKNINTSASLCKDVRVTGYGVFTCLTNKLAVQSSHVIKMTFGANEIACEANGSCSFEQLEASSPVVTGITISAGNVLTFTGTSFPSNVDYTLSALFKSASVDVASWTTTEAIATFPNGIPASVAADNAEPRLKFTRKADNVIFISYSTQTLTNTVTVAAADSASGLSSSFAGGLGYTITKANIYATLLESGNGITVCGNPCLLDATQSNAIKAVCKLPKLTTVHSATTYQISQSGPIDGNWTAKVSAEVNNVKDNVWPSEYTDPAAGCWIELAVLDGHVGVLDSAKILINNLPTNKTPFATKTKLQGWDGAAYIDIKTLDTTINEGWNTFEWTSNKPAYSKYRWYGSDAGSCRFGEIKFFGIVAKSDTATSVSCTPKITIGSTSTDLSPVTYAGSSTPTITELSQRYGKVTGGESLTIKGTNFVDGSTTVTIDTIPCAITSVTTTQIVCTLGSRPGDQPNPTLNVFVANKGLAANQGHTFKYVQYWSESSTWGNDAPPQYGEAVSIPVGRTLLVDVDKVPQLSFILVEGALIFAPHPSNPLHQRTFDAGYIFVNGGYMEVGTEVNPYTSKITITMHGDVSTPAIPVYGNKNIAVRRGELHLVGKERKVTWTLLDKTAEANTSTITLQSQVSGAFDWAVGEEIVIAPTSYESTEAEKRRITAVGADPTDPLKPILTLDSPLKFRHFAQTVNVGTTGDFIDMRAEVGLLTRNVKYQGDPETSPKNQYGAHIMLHYPADESCIGRILYVELFNVGQAFKLGRYPIHFHIIGTVSKSMVKGNAIHQTYNRAVTIHNVSYFNVINNVVYNTMGHSIFIEDAIETKNVIDRNLVIMTRSSFSLLNTDQTPASFWITHPDNIFTNNRAAGSERYGFWFDLQDNPINGSFTPTICPKNAKLGEFRDNVAHSNGRYGLRIFHSMGPRERPCEAWNAGNPSIPAIFENFTSWKNVRTGAIGEELGAVEWRNFKVADNGQSQLEVSSLNGAVLSLNIALINKALVIGRTVENGDNGTTFGIVGPRGNYFTITDTKFYNLSATSGALGDCSHCEHAASTDSGARTIFTSKLTFDTSVKRKIQYRTPFRGIFSDLDGTLTGLGANSWCTPFFKHNDWSGQCQFSEEFNGHICNPSVQVRRISISGITPASFSSMNMKVLKYDAALLGTMGPGELQTYKDTESNYSVVTMKQFKNPDNSWTLPYVMGHKYKIYWEKGQLDYQTMTIALDQVAAAEDQSVVFNLAFNEKYEAIDFIAGSVTHAPGTLVNPDSYDAAWVTGFNNWSMQTKEINFVINSKSSKSLLTKTIVCREKKAEWCIVPVVVVPGACEGTSKNWSDAASWITESKPAGGVPVAGDVVTIPPGGIMVYDIEDSPIFKQIIVYGCLQFLSNNSKDQKIQAESIYITGGKFNIGTSSNPYTRKATIVLHGDHKSDPIVLDTEQNTKSISNIGVIGFYGKSRSLMARLQAEAQKGSTALKVDTGLDWTAGDVLGFAPTAIQNLHHEEATVTSYNSATGDLVISSALQFYHFGAAASTNFQGTDLRGEVFLLSRNILIEGSHALNTWNGVLVTADLTLIDTFGKEQKFSGITNLEYVEFKNMGQYNNQKAALNFWNSLRTSEQIDFSSIKGVSIHKAAGWGIRVENSQNITFKDSIVFQATQIGVNLIAAKFISAENTNVVGVVKRTGITFTDKLKEIEGCLYGCTFSKEDRCTKVTWTNSIFAGCPLLGLKTPAYGCTDTVGQSSTNYFGNNVIHSVSDYGIWLQKDNGDSSQSSCLQISDLKIAKCGVVGFGIQLATNEIRVTNVVSIDNAQGISVMVGSEGDINRKTIIKNSFIYGDSNNVPKDCPSGNLLLADECTCKDKVGLLATLGLTSATEKGPMIIKADANWATKTEIRNVNFIDFRQNKSACGAKQFAIKNQSSPDNTPVQYMHDIKFTDVAYNAMIFLDDPNPGWAVIDDCGNFPCTAPYNVIFNFYDAIFESPLDLITLPTFWVKGTTTKYSFQVVSNSKSASSSYPNATLNGAWNAWQLADPAQTLPFQIGHLYFESLDADKLDRSVQPVLITNSDGYSNTLNSFMDHGWDGFYTSQKRLTRFPSQVQTNKSYLINFTGTPPQNMRYKLEADAGTKGVLLKIPYPNAGSYSVQVNGNIITPLPLGASLNIDDVGLVCGTNRYVGVVNYLQFYLTPGCTINVVPRDAILCSVRLQWTLNDFFASGETTFTQRLAAILGIDISRVKIVAAYNGSLNLQIQILDDASKQIKNEDGSLTATAAQLAELKSLNTLLLAKLAANPNELGAPLLDITNVVKSNAIINVAIPADQIIQTQIGGAFNLTLPALALMASTLALLA